MLKRSSFVKRIFALVSAVLLCVLTMLMFVAVPSVEASTIPNSGFEDGTFTGWNKGSQSGTLGNTITGSGTGVTIFTGSRTFTHGSRGAVGDPSSPYYAPAVASGSWTFSPNNGTNAVLLQPKGEQTFDQAASALNLSANSVTEIKNLLTSQAQASGNGGGTPTDAAWITREVELEAGTTYTMAWNYVGTDYVPYNDGSITSLVPVTVTGTPVVTVNNYVKQYALLGFTNPGTGDYSTNSYGATGWQTSTYEVSISGTYELGFASFNLDDTGLPPALMVDSEIGSTERCISGTCTSFGGVPSNNETAPTVAPTTTSTTSTTTTTTLPPAVSLVVTSLDDTTSSGTLRWAITQANATAGGIYDSITFDIDGTIILTSALPQVTQNLTVTGNGRTQTIIDGNNLYRPFNVASTKSLTISNMTLKQGQATNGGLIFNGSGTVVATNIRFTGMNGGSAVFNNNNGSTATYTNCTFDYLNIGIAGDYGSTPQLATGVTTWANESDSVFTNKTYVINSVFTNNTYGINNYRFTKVENSQFTNNSYGASVTGLNRTQILDSTFTSNGIGIYHNSWIPTTFNMGTDNRLITGNTFTDNSISMYLDDGYNNGQKNQSWVTITGNSWDALGVWVRYYQWNGISNAQGTARPYTTETVFAQSSNTFPDTIGAPSNLTATDTGAGILLDWDAPVGGGYLPERYAISWSGSLGGGGIATGNVGDANALNTSIELSYALIYSFGEAGETFPFHIRSDNDTFGKYSADSNVVSIQVGTPLTTTTTSTTTTTVYVTPVDNTTTTVPYQPVPGPSDSGQSDNGGGDSSPTDTTEPPYIIPLPGTEPTTVTLPTGTLPETEGTTTTVPYIISLPEEGEKTGSVTTLPNYTDGSTTSVPYIIPIPVTEETSSIITYPNNDDSTATTVAYIISLPDNSETDEIVGIIEDVDFTKVTDKQFESTIDVVFDGLDKTEDVATVLGTFLNAEISDKQIDAILDKVFDGSMTATETASVLTTLLDGPMAISQLSTIMDKVFEDISDTNQTVAVITKLFDGPLSSQELTIVTNSVFSENATVAQMSSVITDLLDKELDSKKLDAVFDAVFDDDLSDKETIDLIVDVLKKDITSEALGSALNAVFDKKVSTEILVETFTAVLGTELNKESVGVIVEVLESETISSEQVSTVVTLIIEQEVGVNAEQATELATSPKVLESIDGSQATEVFAAVDVSEVSQETGAEIVEALAEAPTDVKEAFEEEINVFAGVFDTYVAIDSVINVGDRRTVIAVGAAVAVAGAITAAGGVSPSSGGGAPSGGSGSPSDQNVAARKEEEEEPNGELAWDGVEWIKQLTIFRYNNGVKILDWGLFMKKFVYGLFNLGFTISGSLVVYLTLSGNIQTIAGVSSVLALIAAMYLHMREPDNN